MEETMNRKRKFTEEQTEQMRKLRKIGWSYARIARSYGASVPTIIYHTRRVERASIEQVLSLVMS